MAEILLEAEKMPKTKSGIIIEVYNASQPIEIYKVDENGKRHGTILNSEKIRRECQYEGKKFLNAYTLQCKASDLENYVFSANIKAIHKIERKPEKISKLVN